MKKETLNTGFTIIELLLYVGLIVIFIGAVVQLGWQVIYGRVKSQVQIEVNHNLRLASKRIEYEIRNASGINSVNSTSINLSSATAARNPTVIDLSGGRLRVGFGSSGSCPSSSTCPITSNLVTISSLSFTNLSQGNSANIGFSLTVQHNNPGNRQEWDRSQSYAGSTELRSN